MMGGYGVEGSSELTETADLAEAGSKSEDEI
jgi:hypothetical protein